MIGVFNTIRINSTDILAPNDFQPAREDVYTGEITTCTGKLIADRIGWKYADMSLEWDMLPQADLMVLIGVSGMFDFTFTDVDGTTVTESAIPKSRVYTGTRYTDQNGNVVWRDVQFGITFVNTHN